MVKILIRNNERFPLIATIIFWILYIFSFFSPLLTRTRPEYDLIFWNNFHFYLIFLIISLIKYVALLIFSILYYKLVKEFRKNYPNRDIVDDVGFNFGATVCIIEFILLFAFPFMISSIQLISEEFVEVFHIPPMVFVLIWILAAYTIIIIGFISSYKKYANFSDSN